MSLPAEFELLLKVLQAPDDDEPRLVYADVLQERGDARGEFIPLQCALAKAGVRSDPERFAAMRAREGALLSDHGELWMKQAAPFRVYGYFRRGFVEEFNCLPGELLHRGLEVVAPIRVLRLDGDTSLEVAQRVMALPTCARVTELAVCLVESPTDGSLRHAGASLRTVRQLSPEPDTVALLEQLGWLGRLERLELPMTGHVDHLLNDLVRLRPKNLQALWLKPRADAVGREGTAAIERLWAAMPGLTVRWRAIDYRADDAAALVEALSPARPRAAQVPGVEVQELVAPPAPATLAAGDGPAFPPMELVPMVKPPPPTAAFDRWLTSEGLVSRGFLPRAVPQSITVLRASANGVPVVVAVGPAGTFGAVPFAQDIARLMSMPDAPDLLHVERTAMLERARWAVFESFEGVSLWELLQLHPRLPPGLVLRVLGQTARAAARLDAWQACTDDVLLDLTGQVRLLPGFPGSVKAEEPDYSPEEERHRLGAPADDDGSRLAQLGTALFELLTGTSLVDGTGRSMIAAEADRHQLSRLLAHEGLTLTTVDPALVEYEPLLARALSHVFGERFAGPAAFGEALLSHPKVAPQAELAQWVRAALDRVPRTKDGR